MPRTVLTVLGLASLAAVPLVLDAHAVSVVTTALIAALFAVAFNLLSGQAGLLSFGHAAYFGVGGFAVIHAMRAAASGLIVLPTPLVPLAGGLAGLLCGVLAAFFATRRSGVYFSMVTLAMAELLHALAPNMSGAFGGEVGLSSMRMPWLVFDFGSETQVYAVVLTWTCLGLLLLHLYNRTLFGRLTLGLRESERRVQFLGYDAKAIKIVVFATSALFSGLAGGLLAFATESMNYAVLGSGTSATVVLHTFIGGSAVFLGPALGAFVFTLFGSFVSDLTKNWLLYQGLLFVLVMMFMGGGIATLLTRVHGEVGARNWAALARRTLLVPPILLAAAGTVCLIEIVSRVFDRDYVAQAARLGTFPPVRALGVSWAPDTAGTWAVPVLGIVLGLCLIRVVVARGIESPPSPDAKALTPAGGVAK